MKQHSIRYIFGFLWVSVIFTMTSCVKELLLQQAAQDDGQKVVVELNFKIPPIDSPKQALLKRAEGGGFSTELFPATTSLLQTRSAGTTELYNLWAFQFNADGSINGVPQKISDEVSMVNDMAILDVALKVATNQTIYLVVLGKKVTADLSMVRSKKELERLPLDYLSINNGLYLSRITGEEEVPFAGSVEGVTIKASDDGLTGVIEYNKPEGFGGGIEIRRLVSRIMLKHKFDLTQNTLEGLRLLKVPSKIYLNTADIAADAIKYIDIDALLSSEDIDADGYFTSVWYVAPNMRGDVTGILSESDRYRKEESNIIYGKAPELATNIEMWSYANAQRDNYMIHQIYVGKNNTSNFDIEANHYYNLRTTVNSADVSDGRIRTYIAKQKIYFTSNERAYASGIEGVTGVFFDVHFGQRPIIINTQGRNVTVGIYRDKACIVPIDMNDPQQNWLQLSTYSNYTEVVRNKPNSLSNGISTDIILPTRLKFYLYCDEYVFNEDGSIPTTDIDKYSSLKDRTLYLKVTTTEIGVTKPQKLEGIYTVKQRQGVYCGFFGGDIVSGQYEKALIMDNVDEFAIRYDDLYPVKLEFGSFSAAPRFGYYGVSGYGVNSTNDYKKLVNGQWEMRNLAENPNNVVMSNNANDRFSEIKKINGFVDLYQYDYYKTFAARFCYDLNRDENGNGVIDAGELKWYLPSPYQLLGMRVGFGKKQLTVDQSNSFSDLMHGALELGTTNSYTMGNTGYGAGSGVSNVDKMINGKIPRCVREVNVPDHYKTTNQVGTTTVDGLVYAMLDLSDMPNGIVDRTKNLDKLYTDIELYTYSTTGELTDPKGGDDYSKPSLDNEGNQIRVKRTRKHSLSYSVSEDIKDIVFFVSRKFIISPTDVYDDGDVKANSSSVLLNGKKNNNQMTWAVANGWLATANTSGWLIESKATMTGCYAYRGKNGTDPQGSWRTPTYRELSMILLFIHEIENTTSATGFQKFVRYTDDLYAYNRYWASTQGYDDSRYGSNGGLSKSGIPFGSASNAAYKTGTARLRCIRDIP